MSRLEKLRTTASLHELAHLLGYQPKGLAYVIYGIPDSAKYKSFSIPKRSGGARSISAPIPELKRLQKHLANLLESSTAEIEKIRRTPNKLSHGFRPKHSILTNATPHRGRRYVFNIDLKDFFGTINFGRVFGYLVNNRDFALNKEVARIITQIACHNKSLPQGSPCSPVISNLIGHLLDIRMAQIAKRAGCHYSRYADDLTFSTNKREFPSSIAQRIGETTEWSPGKSLTHEIKRAGFQINPTKTRMQFKDFRQDVTGIIVNSKLSVRCEYRKNVRSMVHSLVTTGEFFIKRKVRDQFGAWIDITEKGTDSQLRGMLSFIDSVRHFEEKKTANNTSYGQHKAPRKNLKEMDGHTRLYRRFLLFTQFFQPAKPLIICEGKTDNVYIRCALRNMAAKYPSLAASGKGGIELKISLFSYSSISDRVLGLGGGTGDICEYIANYGAEFSEFSSQNRRHPVIFLIDNDSGAKQIFSTIKRIKESTTNIDGSEPYYFIKDNLYVIPTPKNSSKDTSIEDFFAPSILATKLGGKEFSRSDSFDNSTQYGKHIFAEHVIKKNATTIDFSGFGSILERIAMVINQHEMHS